MQEGKVSLFGFEGYLSRACTSKYNYLVLLSIITS